MQIDWITVAAQILNFLVLVWLLNIALYRPVTRAMEAREKSIRDQFAEAERREEEAAKETELFRTERSALEQRSAEMLVAAEEEARELTHRLEDEVRNEIEARREAWAAQLRNEQAHFLGELRHHVSGHVGRVARRVLADLAGAELEAAMVDAFIARIGGVEAETLAELRAEAKDAGGAIVIESALVLKAECRVRLEEAVREAIHPEAQIGFREEPDLICGIRLRIHGQTLQWNVHDYLGSLEEETDALLDAAGVERPAEAAGRS